MHYGSAQERLGLTNWRVVREMELRELGRVVMRILGQHLKDAA
jgi:hypothetical protein